MRAPSTMLPQARSLYRSMPADVRRLTDPAARLIMRSLNRFKQRLDATAPEGEGVTIAGLFSTPCGMGEGARLCADALQRLGWRVERLDLSPTLCLDSPSMCLDPELPLARGPVIIHLNPPRFRMALALIGRGRLRRRPVIAYWAWELEELPPEWCRAARGLTEIWTPSDFSATALRSRLRIPVRVVPHPVPRRTVAADRSRFGLPKRTCIFLTFVNFHSNVARKNPQATIAAYARAFPVPRDDVLLVIKLEGALAAPDLAHRLRTMAADCACPVRFIIGTLDQAGRDALIASCDVLVSLHRSEGFGLTLAEAMSFGTPVVATAWSGNLDFMAPYQGSLVRADLVPVCDPQDFYAPGGRWAEPDVGEAAGWLRSLADNPQLRTRLTESAAGLDLVRRFEAAVSGTCLAHSLPPPDSPPCQPRFNLT